MTVLNSHPIQHVTPICAFLSSIADEYKAKSAVAKPSVRKFLGFSFTGGKEVVSGTGL
jgi:hypothetical protein